MLSFAPTHPLGLPADSTRETGVLQAYFAAGAVKGVATACHNQKIRDCVCNFDGPVESNDEEGNLIYRTCKENTEYSIDYVLNFIFPGLTVTLITERYNYVFRIIINGDESIGVSIDKTAIAGAAQPTAEPTPGPSEDPAIRILNDVHNTVVGLKVSKLKQGGREGRRDNYYSELNFVRPNRDQSKARRRCIGLSSL